MFLFDESTQAIDVSKYFFEVLVLIISNVVTFIAVRRKNESDIFKNIADAHKSEADSAKTNIETISLLNKEIDASIEKLKELRTEVSTLEELIDVITDSVTKLIRLANTLVDELSIEKAPTVIRQRAVNLLESLYTLREALSQDTK